MGLKMVYTGQWKEDKTEEISYYSRGPRKADLNSVKQWPSNTDFCKYMYYIDVSPTDHSGRSGPIEIKFELQQKACFIKLHTCFN